MESVLPKDASKPQRYIDVDDDDSVNTAGIRD